jgi:two-component system, OmpR family, phosphate regulon sensor histidine kinase PhoR
MKPSSRERLTKFVLVPALIVAVAVLGYFTLRTTLRLDQLRKQAVLEATLGLATEKATRLDRLLIDQDNTVMAIAEPQNFQTISERWLPTARRETPTVRAIALLDESHQVLTWVSRASPLWEEEDAFRLLLLERMQPEMDWSHLPYDELRHLHKSYGGQSYLVSYWKREWLGRTYFGAAWHDMGRVVRETFPLVYGDPAAPLQHRVNVVDEEGRNIFGPPLRTGEFTVGVRFPTTLYNWRVQVSPISGEAIAEGVQRRHRLELVLVSLSFLVIVAGAIAIIVTLERERKLSTLRNDFVANVSHELKTPLALVRMFAEMLHSGRVANDAKRTEYLSIIMNESERLSGLIENVLDFAKLERGRGKLEFEQVALEDVVGETLEGLKFRAEQLKVEIRLEIASPLSAIEVDPRAVSMALTNLVDNALKYAPESRTIDIRLVQTDRVVRLEVEDEGNGVNVADREKIFERFERGDPAKRGQIRGSGIGLALVKHVAESHGGRAWVEDGHKPASNGPGQERGARFCMEFPRRTRLARDSRLLR